MHEETLDPTSGQQIDPNLGEQPKQVERGEPEVEESTEAFISNWFKVLDEAEAHWKNTFDRMRAGAKFAAGNQWDRLNQPLVDDRYTANITLRHINQRVATLYAKNPRVRAERKQKLWDILWDGTSEMLQQATVAIAMEQRPEETMQMIQAGAMQRSPMDANMAKAVMLEAQQTIQEKDAYDKMGRTLELVAQYSLDEIIPSFKVQAKQLVRRVLTCSVGFVKLGYQRMMEPTPEIDAKIKDDTDKLKHLEHLAADLEDEEIDKASKEAEELRTGIEALQQQQNIVLREGLVFGFPKSWAIIIDPNVVQLKGFVGAGWLAEKYTITKRQVQEIYGIALEKGKYTSFKHDGTRHDKRKNVEDYATVYEVYNLHSRITFTIIHGYKDYVKRPGEPDVEIEQFHPYFTLTFNDIESDENIYPPSDVELIKPMALEYNRAREALRMHRIANTPATIITKGVFNKNDLDKITGHYPNEVIETKLNKNDDITKLMRSKPVNEITPELYNTDDIFRDTQRVVGTQEADLAATARVSATATNVAEGAKATSTQSNIDDLDEMLTALMRAAGQVLFKEMTEETAKKIAGKGAMWPNMQREQVAEELLLTVKAGSSGRPNKAGRMAMLDKLLPYMLQMPNMDPDKITELQLREFDENLDIEDFTKSGMPSVVALNQMNKPNMAGQEGAGKTPGGGALNTPAPNESPSKTQNLDPGGDSGLPPEA